MDRYPKWTLAVFCALILGLGLAQAWISHKSGQQYRPPIVAPPGTPGGIIVVPR
jgi:hypothetical protein